MARKRAAVIMAAGKGTRMKDPTKAKVMYEVLGHPMIHYVVDLAYEMKMDRIITIVGWQREIVTEFLRGEHPTVEIAVQTEQKGTGHAVMQAEPLLRGFEGDVVVLSGDVPLLQAASMNALIDHHKATHATASILTATFDDPTGYGRIVRKGDGSVDRIVEHKDASEEERKIREINSGIYVFDKAPLFDALTKITPENVQHEYYLTDVFRILSRSHRPVSALLAEHPDEIHGVNTFDQLQEAKEILSRRAASSMK